MIFTPRLKGMCRKWFATRGGKLPKRTRLKKIFLRANIFTFPLRINCTRNCLRNLSIFRSESSQLLVQFFKFIDRRLINDSVWAKCKTNREENFPRLKKIFLRANIFFVPLRINCTRNCLRISDLSIRIESITRFFKFIDHLNFHQHYRRLINDSVWAKCKTNREENFPHLKKIFLRIFFSFL